MHRSGRSSQAQSPASYRSAQQSLSQIVSAAARFKRLQRQENLKLHCPKSSSSGNNLWLTHALRRDVEGKNRFDQPCLAAGGGGIFFFWQLGALEYIAAHYNLEDMQFVGASAGALTATIAACNVDLETSVKYAYRLSVEADLWNKRLGLLGIWGGLIRRWLEGILPQDAHLRSRGRLRLVTTDLLSRRQVYLQDFTDRTDLIAANMASIHIPFFLDYKPFSFYRQRASVDGSLTDFLFWENGKLLVMEGRSFVLDYSQDEELEFQRLDFVKLKTYESIRALMQQGRHYAARVDASGAFEASLGEASRCRGV